MPCELRDQLAEMLHEMFTEAVKRTRRLHGNGMLSVPFPELSKPDKDWWRKRGDAVKKIVEDADMLDEYDFSKGVRGKYAKKERGGQDETDH